MTQDAGGDLAVALGMMGPLRTARFALLAPSDLAHPSMVLILEALIITELQRFGLQPVGCSAWRGLSQQSTLLCHLCQAGVHDCYLLPFISSDQVSSVGDDSTTRR